MVISFDFVQVLPYALFVVSEILGVSPIRINSIIDIFIVAVKNSFRKNTIDEQIQETVIPREVV